MNAVPVQNLILQQVGRDRGRDGEVGGLKLDTNKL